jgi:hypothetical protein
MRSSQEPCCHQRPMPSLDKCRWRIDQCSPSSVMISTLWPASRRLLALKTAMADLSVTDRSRSSSFLATNHGVAEVFSQFWNLGAAVCHCRKLAMLAPLSSLKSAAIGWKHASTASQSRWPRAAKNWSKKSTALARSESNNPSSVACRLATACTRKSPRRLDSAMSLSYGQRVIASCRHAISLDRFPKNFGQGSLTSRRRGVSSTATAGRSDGLTKETQQW